MSEQGAKEGLRVFYHVTRKEYVSNILSSFLLPGKEVQKRNIYHGISGDPVYIYLWNEKEAIGLSQEVIKGEHSVFKSDTHALLKIVVPPSFPVEKDYDQLLFILNDLNDLNAKDWRNLWVEPFLKRLGIKFKGHLSRENLMHHIDLVPDEVWDKKIGSYRTSIPICGKNIKDVGFEEIAISHK